MSTTFDPTTIDRLRAAQEVEIGTHGARVGEPHRTIIWIVVDEQDRVLIRSVRGAAGRWYRDALADPRVSLEVDGRVIPARVEVASDAERIAAASQALRTKYARARASLAAMLREETLPTTLELLPR
ncbi:MAG: nitroreductase/quinone reductase family protein [Chloroflexota bacterium]